MERKNRKLFYFSLSIIGSLYLWYAIYNCIHFPLGHIKGAMITPGFINTNHSIVVDTKQRANTK